MQPTSIFIKTCKRDLGWLDYCLRSLPFFTSEKEVILVADADCYPTIHKYYNLVTKLIYLPTPNDGYLWQQVVKLQAHKYCAYESIIYLDSDCIFNRYCDISDLLVNDKFCIGYRNIDSEDCNNTIFNLYNRIVKKELNIDTPYEFNMLVPPNIWKSTLVNLESKYPQIVPSATNNSFTSTDLLVTPSTFTKWLKSDKAIIEFNIMYAFAYTYEKDRYHWLTHTECSQRQHITTFGWSWDNLDSKREQLESVLSRL